ncbi:MAG: 50S ribosomal protein L13 [Elusimicrobiota bacterium]|nr:50S ribosomal protein L13 [Elusimicrobiota bacterium]
MNNRSYYPKATDIRRDWHLIDATDKVLGRLSTQIAGILLGKHKPYYTRGVDCGDFVVVINSSKIKVTGKKPEQKIYFRHSGYVGGDKYIPFGKLFKQYPEKVLYLAVKGMLPKNKLRKKLLKRLKIYSGDTHPHGKFFKGA